MDIFNLVLINPIFNVLIAFYKALSFTGLPGALGFAIILLTVLIRVILWPLTTAQLRSAKKMASLKPHLDRIKVEHGHDKVRHQQEISKLYKEQGINPLAGCLPLVLQIPVFIALYNVLLNIVQFDKADFLTSVNRHLYTPSLHLDKIPDTSFLGLNLAAKPNQWQQIGVAILIIPVITGVLQLIQSKMMVPAQAAKSTKPAKSGESMQDSMSQVQGQMTYIMPVMIAFFSYGFPLGLSLYWNTFTVIGIIQQYLVAGPGSINKYLPQSLRKNN